MPARPLAGAMGAGASLRVETGFAPGAGGVVRTLTAWQGEALAVESLMTFLVP